MAEEKSFLKKEFIRTMKKDLAGTPVESAPPAAPVLTSPSPEKTETEIAPRNDVLEAELREREKIDEQIRQEEETEKEEKLRREFEWQKELDRIKKGAAGAKSPEGGPAVFEQEETQRLDLIRKELEDKEKGKDEDRRRRELAEKEGEEKARAEAEQKVKLEEDKLKHLEELKAEEEQEKKKIELLKQEQEMRARLEALKKEEETRRKELERLKKEEEMKIREEEEKRMKIEEELTRREELKRKEEELKIREEEEKKIKDLARMGILSPEEGESSLDREREESGKARERLRKEEEIKKIREDRERKEQNPEIRKKLLLEKKRKLNAEKETITQEKRQISIQKKPLEGPKSALLKEIEGIKKASQAIFDKEAKMEEEEKAIEEKEEKATTTREKKLIEKERWSIEDRRRALEMRRWPWEEKMKEINEKIKKIDFQFSAFDEKEEIIKIKEKEISDKEKKIDVELEQIDLKDRLNKIEEIRVILEDEKRAFFDDIDAIEEKLNAIYQEESSAEEEEKSIEQQEKETSDFGERKNLEKKRWAAEEKRRKIESSKWQLENEKEAKEIQLRKNEEKLNELLGKAKLVVERIKDIDKELNIVPEETVKELEPELEIKAPEQPKEEKIPAREPAKPQPGKIVVGATAAEEATEAGKEIEDKFLQGKQPAQKKPQRVVEDEVLKREMQDLAGVTVVPEPGVSDASAKIEEAKKRLETLKNIQPANEPAVSLKEEPKEEPIIEQKEELKEGMATAEIIQKIKQQSPQPIESVKKEEPEKEQEISESLRSVNGAETVGSLHVDTEEEKARKEVISKLQTQPADKRFASVASTAAIGGNVVPNKERGAGAIAEKIKSLKDNLPTRPGSREKIWTRVAVFGVILAILTGVVTFWYWWFIIRTQPPPITIECTENADCSTGEICRDGKCAKAAVKCSSNAECKTGESCDASGNCVVSGPITESPTPLFGVDTSLTRESEISSNDEIKPLLSQLIQEDQEKNTFRRILIKNKKDNNYITLKDVFNALEVRAPADFYTSMGDNYTLFIYSQVEGNRLGVVAEAAKTQELTNAVRTEESTMKDDYKTLLNLMSGGNPAKVQQFRDAVSLSGYSGPNFRYLTTYTNDIGLCYLVSQDRYIFTTSITSIEKLISRMAIEMPVTELTKDLDSKSVGDDVKLLQTWLASDASIYPSGKITGKYDTATKTAVTKFQEKYASEILAPQGLYEGTGNVDERTRMKLNELYAKSGIRPKSTELINDLRFGSSGDEVRLLQTWLAKDTTIYPEGLVTGWFGSLTERAVKKFQERYDKEILIPNGLSKGTGVVDKATRDKLNALYR